MLDTATPSSALGSLISSDDYVEIVRAFAPRQLDVFYNHIFRDSLQAVEGTFAYARHVDEWCQRLQAHHKTGTISARKHLKTTTFHAFLGWRLFRLLFATEVPAYEEWLWLSYSTDLSQYHLKKLKKYVEANAWLKGLKSLTDAESILHYQAPERPGEGHQPELLIEPAGMTTFKRGRHPHGVLADDILRDPEKKLDLTQIEKMTRIFLEEVVSMPKEGGALHVAGTPQDKEDLFFALKQLGNFDVREYPAFVDAERRIALWPEVFSFERLEQIRDKEIGRKAFLKEYLCRPVREVSGYFEDQELDAIIDPKLVPMPLGEPAPGREFVIGLDLGKKTHPSHLSLLEVVGDELVQRRSQWFDQTDYVEQVEVIKAIDQLYALVGFCYDDTRNELESFKEKQELPRCAVGVPFTAKEKFQIAARIGSRVRHKTLRLLPDPRQRRSLLSVDDDLNAPETAEGHGDAFWSNALAVRAQEGRPEIGFTVIEIKTKREDED